MTAIAILSGATAQSPSQTMSSREIAELVGSRHDKVKQSIERLAERSVISLPPLGEYLDTLGRTAKEYQLAKRDSLIVVAQLCPEFTARIVDRWQELEAQQSAPTIALPDFTNPAVAARAWADAIEQKQAIEVQAQQVTQQLALVAPKAEALDRISASDGTLTFTQVSKLLSIKRETLTQWLHANGWIYRQNGSWIAHDAQIKTRRLVYKEAKYTDEHTGQEVRRPYCHVTQKGLTWLAENGPVKVAA